MPKRARRRRAAAACVISITCPSRTSTPQGHATMARVDCPLTVKNPNNERRESCSGKRCRRARPQGACAFEKKGFRTHSGDIPPPATPLRRSMRPRRRGIEDRPTGRHLMNHASRSAGIPSRTHPEASEIPWRACPVTGTARRRLLPAVRDHHHPCPTRTS